MKLKKELIQNLLLLKDCAKLKYPSECILNLKNGQQELLFFGCQHSFSPSDRKFDRIEKLFKKFCFNKSTKNTAVVLEKFLPPSGNAREESIKKYGETGLVSFLARKKKIKVFCPEPNHRQSFDFMIARGCQKIDIVGWIVLNILNTKKEITENDAKQIISILEQLKKQLKFKGDIVSQVIKKINLVAGKEILTFKNNQFYCKKSSFKIIYNLQNPLSDKTVFNRVGVEINLARDYFIAEQILARLKKKIFLEFLAPTTWWRKKKYIEIFLKNITIKN
jgi:hypothetical protein